MTKVGGIAGEQLRSIIERIERLEEEKAALAADIRDIYAEAKGNGFDNKALRQIVKLRKMDSGSSLHHSTRKSLYARTHSSIKAGSPSLMKPPEKISFIVT